MRSGILIVALLAFMSAAGGCSHARRKPTFDEVAGHMAKKTASWESYDRGRRLEDKIYSAPPMLVDFLTLDNDFAGFPERPSSADLDPALVADFKAALNELPEPLRNRINRDFIGFYFIHQLGGTAYTDTVSNPDKSLGGIYMILDVDAINRKANDWMAWKENSPFKAEDGYRLDAEIEKPENDNRKNAIQYILLHEMGHIYSVHTRAHPLWTMPASEVKSLDGYDYINLSWKLDAGPPGKDKDPKLQRYVTLFDSDFPERSKLRYYSLSKSEFPLSQATDIYLKLWRTNLPTLYGAGNPYDDFAELFVEYVHSVILKKPWAIRIRQGDRLLLEHLSCAYMPRCEAKRRILEKYLREDGIIPKQDSAFAVE